MTDPFRPTSWNEFVGQTALKRELAVRIAAAKERERPLCHVLLCSIPGVGKTSLAHVIANELDEALVSVTCPITLRALTGIVKQHEGVLLLDEVHRLKRGQEDLLPLLLDGRLELPNGNVIEAPWLTIIAASTEPQQLIKPLVDRFDCQPVFDDYTEEQITEITLSMAGSMDVPMTITTAEKLAAAALGVPRHARRFILAYRDLLAGATEPPSADDVLAFCRISEDGLGVHHERLLETLFALGNNSTAGLRVLSNLLRLNESVVEELEQPLIKMGLLEYSERGRTLTRDGFARVRNRRAATT